MGVLAPFDKSAMAKFDPNEIKTIIVRVPGGEVPPVPALAPKVGPMKLVSLFFSPFHALSLPTMNLSPLQPNRKLTSLAVIPVRGHRVDFPAVCFSSTPAVQSPKS